MIDIKEKKNCCGCNACVDMCPKQCIDFQCDDEGFSYPYVDLENCVNCGLCEKVCPITNDKTFREGNDLDPETVILQIKEIEERFFCTSGGFYPVLAEYYLTNGWYVAGHVFNEDFTVSSFITNDIKDLDILRNSKYLQSNTLGFYSQIKKLLKDGENVLASGCPCQIAALKNYLGKSYSNLLTVDFTCMGIDSPLAFKKYLESLEIVWNSKILKFKSKCKETGWRRLANKVTFENGKTYFGIKGKDANLNATFLDVLVRPSCYSCKFKGKQRIADMSIGDFWNGNWTNLEQLDFSIDDNSGTSYVMLNNDKAKDVFGKIKYKFVLKECSADVVIKGNRYALMSLPCPDADRKRFYDGLHTERFDVLVNSIISSKCKKNSNIKALRNLLGKILRHYKYNIRKSLRCVYYNVCCKQINVDYLKGDVIYTDDNVVLDLNKSARLNVQGEIALDGFAAPIVIRMDENSHLSMDNVKFLGGNIQIIAKKNSTISIGNITALSSGLYIESLDSISIGDFCHISRNVTIADNDMMILTTLNDKSVCQGITIGNHCLLMENTIVRKGCALGDETIVLENSVVVENTSPLTVIGGNPAVVVSRDKYWKNNI